VRSTTHNIYGDGIRIATWFDDATIELGLSISPCPSSRFRVGADLNFIVTDSRGSRGTDTATLIVRSVRTSNPERLSRNRHRHPHYVVVDILEDASV